MVQETNSDTTASPDQSPKGINMAQESPQHMSNDENVHLTDSDDGEPVV